MGKVLEWFGIGRSEVATRDDGTVGTLPAPGPGSSPAGAGVRPPARAATAAVSLGSALSIPAAYRAISVLATACSQIRPEAWRDGQVMINQPSLVRKPDISTSARRFVKRTVIGLAGTGNAFWRISRGPDSMITNLEVLNPLAMNWETDRVGRRWWLYSGDPIKGTQRLADNEVKHLRLLEVPGNVMGLGPIQACRQSLAGAIQLRDYFDNWFSDAAIPTGVLSTNQQMTPELADEYRRRWHQTQAKRDVAVLGNGLGYQAIVLDPADAQFLESQQFSVTDVARLFGIPASYLLAAVEGSSMTYQNLEQADTQLSKYTLMLYLGEIEDAWTDLVVRGQSVQFRVADLLRPDARTRMQVATGYVNAGVWTPNEARAQEGLPPIAGGDKLQAKPQPLALTAGDKDTDDQEQDTPANA